jgi:2-polyprenyl-3-methyl-5-hydroxy-6-metoxy-1,4-benzoquinol methylase
MEMEQRDFDKRAGSWDQEPRRQRLAADIAAVIRELVPLTPTTRLLDYGCGTGLVAMHLLPHVGSLTGLDSSPGMLSVFAGKLSSQEQDRVTLDHLDLAAGGRFSGSFHVIVAAMLLHHVEKPSDLIGQLATHLVPGGCLCLADLDREDGSFHDDPAGVCHFGFDRSSMAAWLHQAGLVPMAMETVSTIEKGSSAERHRAYTVFLAVATHP